MTNELVAEIAAEGTPVHTGGAYGIDATALRATLRVGGRAVVWAAAASISPPPSGHASLFDQASAARGCAVVSEMPLGTAPTRWRFVSRSLLLAAATRATVIAEVGIRSGALAVCTHAHELGRGLGIIPGPITSSTSMGCHALLRQIGTQVITCSADVRELVDPHAMLALDSAA
ncbi:hypothetical protein RL72_00401 [Microbacterium azadirachtae]|uniref:Smf/DprA SLOG domain-containing protein n=1 Tax=Microbacterium azadirachtae TaxID=582680 RepID=A0A0F0L8G4_9MICO|nr:hypothetical protein RL72_00401 [Microbacterium azadirachtae]